MKLRHEGYNICRECHSPCKTRKACDSAKGKLRQYRGIRFTSDGFDCALPVAVDSHSVCSYGCLYCFSDNLIEHRTAHNRPIGQTSLRQIENIFAGEGGKNGALFRKALKYDRRNEAGYPASVQLGAICDPCDNIERQQGWLKEFLKISHKYNQPVRMSTKGDALLLPDYLEIIEKRPDLLWVAFSIITIDDELIRRMDRRAPDTSRRLETMRTLSKMGVKTSLRMRPILPGITDRTPRYEKAYKILIEKAALAGANAISCEVGFTPGGPTKDLRAKWQLLSKIAKVPFLEFYRSFGRVQACTRPSYMWTENIMHAIKEVANSCGLTMGVSDPVWKQLTESGCCCGIKPDDAVFGNWERENATNALFIAKKTGKEITLQDITPPWSYEADIQNIVALPAGPLFKYDGRHKKWADKLQEVWNDLKSQRGPLNYFQGALVPIRRDNNGDMVYKYVGLKRKHPKYVKYWHIS